jgi:hypothetical protein
MADPAIANPYFEDEDTLMCYYLHGAESTEVRV